MGGVADVLANWQNIFRAINLATGTVLLEGEADDSQSFVVGGDGGK
jgi:hypothetical protein